MSLFSRRERPNRRLLTAMPGDLTRLGVMAFGGESPYPSGLPGVPTAELDGYAMAYLAAAGHPVTGSASEATASEQFLGELLEAAEKASDWGFVGGILVGWNCVGSQHQQDGIYLEILDRGLEVLRADGVAYTAIPPFALARWTSIHGYSGSEPTGWPRPLEDMPVPAPGTAPPVDDLAPGEVCRMAQAPAAPQNMILAERRPDGVIQAVIEGTDPESGTLRRWDWEGVTSSDYPSFLRMLGDRIVTHTFWVCYDLMPYIPCRAKSREEMRIEASTLIR